MRTIVIHNKLGRYDFCHPSEKSESYVLKFDGANDKKAVEFTYKEDYAPQLNCRGMMPEDVIEALADHPQCRRYAYSSSYNGIQQKSHEERIKMARDWVYDNRYDDNKAEIERLQESIGKMEKDIEAYRGGIAMLEETNQEIELEHEGSMK